MPPRLLLVRHGQSAHVHRGGWLDAPALHRWRDDYDAAGIMDHSHPPASLVAEAARAGLVVSSDLPRAIVSAERLAPTRSRPASPLLRESPLDIPPWSSARLPLTGWAAVLHLRWLAQIARGKDPSLADRQRVCDAAAWLEAHVREHETVVALTHGVFRRSLGNHLLTLGWRARERRRSYAHWSVWSFDAPNR
jgi:broad specificity phosphatase PhoE